MNGVGVIVFVLGLIGTLLGAHLAVKGLKNLSEVTGLSKVLVGFTIASVGTSLPEIFTNLNAAFMGVPSIGVGTIMGSNISQITLMLGIAGLLTMFYMKRETLQREGVFMILAVVILGLVMLDFYLSRWEALVLILIYVMFLVYLMWDDRIFSKEKDVVRHRKTIKKPLSILQIVFGFVLLIFGSHYLVKSAAGIASYLGVSNVIIGIFVVGVGTSLPELILAIESVLAGSRGIALGTLIGSNITDPLLSIGLGGLVNGYMIEKNVLFFDIPVWILFTLVALYLLYKARPKKEKKEEISRKPNKLTAFILIGLFIVYTVLRLVYFC